MWEFIKNLINRKQMKTLTDIRDEVTAIQQALALIQSELQVLIDASVVTPTPDIPKITVPLNTPIELVA